MLLVIVITIKSLLLERVLRNLVLHEYITCPTKGIPAEFNVAFTVLFLKYLIHAIEVFWAISQEYVGLLTLFQFFFWSHM